MRWAELGSHRVGGTQLALGRAVVKARGREFRVGNVSLVRLLTLKADSGRDGACLANARLMLELKMAKMLCYVTASVHFSDSP